MGFTTVILIESALPGHLAESGIAQKVVSVSGSVVIEKAVSPVLQAKLTIEVSPVAFIVSG